MNNKKMADITVIGFALFSMFFGAGNLLFPPYLGLISGKHWMISFLGFVLADVGLSLLVLAATGRYHGNLDKVLERGGKKLARFIGAAAILCIGPLLAIPRTAATTFEMGVQPVTGLSGAIPTLISSVIFFGLTLVLTIKPSKVVDIVGKFLTPALLICLAALIIIGIINPIGNVRETALISENLFAQGVSQGYLTMDALGAAALSTVVISSINEKGYTKDSDKMKITLQAGLLASIALALVYGGLCYLGSTLSTTYGVDTSQALLMVVITNSLLGYPGKVMLGLIVALACLTTSIGLTSAAAKYFSGISNNKIKYETVVIAACIFSCVISNLGVSNIIKFSSPILDIVYPALIGLVIMSLLGKYIKYDGSFKGLAYVTLFVSVVSVGSNLLSLTQVSDMLAKLPFAYYGFNWIAPAIVGAVIGGLISALFKSNKDTDLGEKEA